MTKFFKSLSLALLLLLGSITYADVSVTVTGQAAGSGRIAKQQALADALREAVRKGIGINIASSSKVTDYVLKFDSIFSRAFGYVKEFKILSSGYDSGIYKVKISAVVSKTSPDMDDYLAMRQIIALKGSPKLLIKVSGKIKAVGDAPELVEGLLREIALKCGFQTIELSQFNESEGRRLKRDRFVGDASSAAYREAGVRRNYDFIISADVSGAYNGKSELYGVTTQRFSLGADLSATYPNGNSIAQLTIPSKETDIAQIADKTQAARSALLMTLGGDKGKNFRALLLRILASWLSEFDTGTRVTVEFPNINSGLFEEIVDGLKNASGVNAVNVRVFDEKLKSIIEVESNLKTYDLGQLVSSLSGERLKVERTTNDYIQMGIDDTYSSSNIAITVIGAIAVLILLRLLIGALRGGKAKLHQEDGK
jgi:hypothetical protein